MADQPTTRAEMVEALEGLRARIMVHAEVEGIPGYTTLINRCIVLASRLSDPATPQPAREAFDAQLFNKAMENNSHDDDAEAAENLAIALHARGLSLDEIVKIAKGEK